MKYLSCSIFCLAAIFFTPGNAQWFEGNSSWYYDFENPCLRPSHGYDIMRYSHDTIIDGKLLAVVNVRSFRVDFYQDTSDYTRERYYLEEDDKIYQYYTDQQKELLYDFTKSIGDTIRWPIENSHDWCDIALVAVLTELDTIMVGDTPLLRQYWTYLNDQDEFGDGQEVIEKIGDTRGPFDHTFQHRCFIDECRTYTFKCFTNTDTDIHYGRENCLDLLLSSRSTLDSEDIKIFPNPASNMFVIQSEEWLNNAFVSIQSMTGETILLREYFPRMEINVSDLSPGVYIISVLSRDRKKSGYNKVLIY